MGNEVLIEVKAADSTGPVKDEIKASWQAFEKSFQPLGLRAENPINSAFIAEVKASVKSLSAQALDIPVNADTAPFLAQVEAQLEELANVARANIPLEVANAQEFRAEVLEQVDAVSQSVKAVIRVDADDASLTDMRAKILAAADASAQEAEAQQKLAQAMQSGNAEEIAKAQADLAAAETSAADAAQMSAEAQEAAAAAAQGLADGEKTAAIASFSLRDAMGPLWMIMNVAQIAMFALGGTSNSTAQSAQNLSQQLVTLGQSTDKSATSTLASNATLKQLNDQLLEIGSSSPEFAAAFSGSLATAQQYTAQLSNAQQQLAHTTYSASQVGNQAAYSLGLVDRSGQSTTMTMSQLVAAVAGNKTAYDELNPSVRAAVDQFNAYTAAVPAAKDQLTAMQAAQAVVNAEVDQLASQMPAASGLTAVWGQNVGDLTQEWRAFAAASPTDSVDQITMAMEQANLKVAQANTTIVTTFQQADQAVRQAAASVVSAQHSEAQAADAVASAQHSEIQAAEGVASAQHGVTSAMEGLASAEHGVQQAQIAYNSALDQERAAQQAVADARRAAVQQLQDLSLQANDAASSALGANVTLFDAQKAAAALGVTPDNAQAIAAQQITDSNEAQIKAADALIAAQNQVADSQNNSAKAQQSLNTARQQGIEGNPGVVSAEKQLLGAQQQVTDAAYSLTQAQQAVTNADYAVQQAHQQVSNALYAQQQATLSVTNAEWSQQQASLAVASAQDALRQAQDNASRSLDLSTAAGQRNMGMLLNLNSTMLADNMPTQARYNALVQDAAAFFGGSRDAAADYLKQLGLIPQDFRFGVSAVASVDMGAINQIEHDYHISATTQRQAVGGPSHGGLTWVGEQGAELVRLPAGASVMPHSNSMMAAASGDAPIPHRAAGGPASLVAANIAGATLGEMYQSSAEAAHVMGLPFQPPLLPAYVPPIQKGITGIRGSAAANRQIVMSIFSSMFGWGSPAEQSATDYVEMRESGYNNVAQNPTSTAYGMFQFLNSTWGGYGIAKTSDPTQQAIAGGRYIASRYGDPIGAAAHERAFSWYGAGGPVGGDGWIGVGEHGPEAVRVPGGSSVRPGAAPAATVAPGPVQVEFLGDTDSAFANYLMRMFREGKLKIKQQWVTN